MHILILGIGNTLLSDEGVGVAAMQMLADELGSDPDLEFLDGGTLSFTLAVPISACDGLIVLDAAMIDGPSGSVGVYEDEAMEEFL
ncbi:MAG TPA: hydrogenase maturation protease, partial [Rhodocyclaceae bacterium]